MSSIKLLKDVLKQLQAARIAEARALGELAAVLARSETTSVENDSQPETGACYLSVRQLTERIPYAEQTIRNLMSTGALVEGHHYFKRRGRIIFAWTAMRAWVEERAVSTECERLPLVRDRKNGRS